jgi:cell shape-determining protein MreC
MTFPLIMALLGFGSLLISALMFIMNKSQLTKLETNHFAHLESDVKTLKEENERFREDITKLFEKCEDMSRDIAFIKGKMNGSLK